MTKLQQNMIQCHGGKTGHDISACVKASTLASKSTMTFWNKVLMVRSIPLRCILRSSPSMVKVNNSVAWLDLLWITNGSHMDSCTWRSQKFYSSQILFCIKNAVKTKSKVWPTNLYCVRLRKSFATFERIQRDFLAFSFSVYPIPTKIKPFCLHVYDLSYKQKWVCCCPGFTPVTLALLNDINLILSRKISFPMVDLIAAVVSRADSDASH